MAILVAWYIAITALAVFQCSPVKKQFDYRISGRCLSFYGTFIGVTAPNFFIDVILLLLPVPMLWNLKIKKTKKLALTANFLLGYWSVTDLNYDSKSPTKHYSVIVVTILRLKAILSVPNDGVDDVPCIDIFH